MMLTAMLGGYVKGLAIDRVRAAAAYPNATTQGKRSLWAAELLSGKLTADVVPTSGGNIRALGHTFQNTWGRSYALSNIAGQAITAVGLFYCIPNAIDGWKNGGGPEGLINTRPGRTGVLGITAAAVEMLILGIAIKKTPAGPGRLSQALQAAWMTNRRIVIAKAALGTVVGANEFGYYDSLNQNSKRSFGETFGDSNRNLGHKFVAGARAAVPGIAQFGTLGALGATIGVLTARTAGTSLRRGGLLGAAAGVVTGAALLAIPADRRFVFGQHVDKLEHPGTMAKEAIERDIARQQGLEPLGNVTE